MTAERIKNAVLTFLAAGGSWLSAQLGGWDTCLAVLMCMMAMDYLTGLLLAAVWKKSPNTETGGISSAASFKGLVRKLMVLALVWLGAMIDKAIGAEYVRNAVCMFFIANEGLSILENTALMGVPYPMFICRLLEALRAQGDEGGAK